jgi:hypothetical protein
VILLAAIAGRLIEFANCIPTVDDNTICLNGPSPEPKVLITIARQASVRSAVIPRGSKSDVQRPVWKIVYSQTFF